LGGALLLKGTAKIAAEGTSAGQFRHGAIEVAAPGLLVVLFSPNGNTVSHLNAQLVRQLERTGAHVLVIGASDGTGGANRLVLDLKVPDEYFAPLFEIVPLQLLSHALAVQRSIIPGTFVNTTPVVVTR
jgi:glucosamine--fructose-6-phosphate aminotransferase (isomerizing)